MMNRNYICYLSVLLAALMLATGCNNDKFFTEEEPHFPMWHVAIDASSSEEGTTRALVLSEDSNRLYTFWTEGDLIKALNGTAEAGILTASIPDADDLTEAKLIGSITGNYAVDDILTLWYPDFNLTYDGQDGTLADISSNHTFLTAQSEVREVDAANSVLLMSNASFNHVQAFLNLTFTDTENIPLSIVRLEIWTEGGKLVRSKVFDTTSYADRTNPIVVSPNKATSRFLLSLRDEQGASTKYHFLATTTDGLSYSGTATSNLQVGHYYKGKLKLSPYVIGREEYGNGNGWDSDGLGPVGRDGYDNGIGWDDFGSVQTNRDGYGLGSYWEYDPSGDTDRDNYGACDNWDSSGSGSTDRDGYSSGGNWDSSGSGTGFGRNSYGSGIYWQ